MSEFEKLLAEFMESEQYKDDSFHWSEMARAFYDKGIIFGQAASAARIAELESELDFQNQCRDGYRRERDMLKKDLEFAYKRAKVLADICKIPVHESPEVTGTILGLVRSHVERLEMDARIMAEELLCFHTEKDFCVVNSAGDRLWRKGPCDCHACIIAAKYREG